MNLHQPEPPARPRLLREPPLLPRPTPARTAVAPGVMTPQRWEVFGQWLIRFCCSCGWQSAAYLERTEGPTAVAEVQAHLVDAGHVDYAGRCRECGVITDEFRAVIAELGEDVWLCPEHAPHPDVIINGGDPGE